MTPWERNAQTICEDARRREADAQADLHNVFRRDGIQMLGRVHEDSVKELRAAIEPLLFKSEGSLDHFDTDAVLSLESLRAIALHPHVTLAAAMHIGAPPKIIDVSAWWSRPLKEGEQPDGAQSWHRDVDDWRACKLFVYLTDVGPDDGPHQFVPGSHRFSYFTERDMAPERYFYNGGREPGVAEVVDCLPRVEITGPAGTMFIANTYCLHRGKVPTRNPRLLFQVCYGLMDQEKFSAGTKIPKIRAAWG